MSTERELTLRRCPKFNMYAQYKTLFLVAKRKSQRQCPSCKCKWRIFSRKRMLCTQSRRRRRAQEHIMSEMVSINCTFTLICCALYFWPFLNDHFASLKPLTHISYIRKSFLKLMITFWWIRIYSNTYGSIRSSPICNSWTLSSTFSSLSLDVFSWWLIGFGSLWVLRNQS